MSTTSRIIRAPGRIIVDPTQAFLGGVFPYGGTELGAVKGVSLASAASARVVMSEGIGAPSDILEANHRWAFSSVVRGWDDDAIEQLFPDAYAEGAISQHASMKAPGSATPGASAMNRARKIVFVPDDPIHAPAVILYSAVAQLAEGSALSFARDEEVGLAIAWECFVDGSARILEVGRLVDLTL